MSVLVAVAFVSLVLCLAGLVYIGYTIWKAEVKGVSHDLDYWMSVPDYYDEC